MGKFIKNDILSDLMFLLHECIHLADLLDVFTKYVMPALEGVFTLWTGSVPMYKCVLYLCVRSRCALSLCS